jgi:seryl-tRNA synthetase
VLFDLLLYKYPLLSKGVFELLVRLFTRKRTLLENLQGIQMLENPRSIQVLMKIKEYYSELKKSIEDADLWLNKVNEQSKKQKTKVIMIFTYFSQCCVQTSKIQKEDEDEDVECDHKHDHGHSDKPPATSLIKKPADGLSAKAQADEYYKTMLNENKRISTKDFMLFENKKGKERVNAEN